MRAFVVAIRFVLYLFRFFYELVLANIQIAKAVLSPRFRFKSVAVKYPSQMKTKTEMILITNSITLTPGTLVMDADLKSGDILIHSMIGESAEKVRKDIARFPESKVLWVTREKE